MSSIIQEIKSFIKRLSVDRVFVFLFFILCTSVFLLEGTGYEPRRLTAFNVLTVGSIVLFLLTALSRKLQIPPWWICFITATSIVCIFISTYYSINLGQSLISMQWYGSLLCIFVFVFSFRKVIIQLFPRIFILWTILFSLLSVISLIGVWIFKFPIPQTSYQFIYPTIAHHQIATWLSPALLVLIIQMVCSEGKNKRKIYLIILSFLLLFFFTFSRSAFLAFSIIGLFILYISRKHIRTDKKVIIFSIFLSLLALFISSTIWWNGLFDSIFRFFPHLETGIGAKTFFGERLNYFQEALRAIHDYPLWGIGGNNFGYASIRYGFLLKSFADSSHNLFLDIAVEHGLTTLLCVCLFICAIVINSFKNVKINLRYGNHIYLIYVIFFSLLLQSQLDYIHRFYTFSLLMVTCLALMVSHIREYRRGLFHSFIIAGIASILFLSLFIIQARLPQTTHIYGEFGATVESALAQGKIETAIKDIQFLEHHFIAEKVLQEYVAYIYLRIGQAEYAKKVLLNNAVWSTLPQNEIIRLF